MSPSAHRRALPDVPNRRGWCPGLARPMPTGDGLLARVHPPLGILTLAQARTVARGARLYGNGHLDLTARANLQIRGVSDSTAAPLARLLEAAGLGDTRHDGGPQRLTLTGPLADHDPAETIDVPALARAIEAAGRNVPGLPAKTLVVIAGRPGPALPEADLFVLADTLGCIAIAVGTEQDRDVLGICAEADAPAVVSTLLTAFAQTGRRRMRDLSRDERETLAALLRPRMLARGPAPIRERDRAEDATSPQPHPARELPGSDVSVEQQGIGEPTLFPSPLWGGARGGGGAEGTAKPNPVPPPPPTPPHEGEESAPRPGMLEHRSVPETGHGSASDPAMAFAPPAGVTTLAPNLSVLAIDAPFGRCTADALDRLVDCAARLGADALRLSPARGFVLLLQRAAPAATLAALAQDFIVARDDPRRSVAACTGAPSCGSGSTPTLADAARLAAAFRPLAARGQSAHVSGCAKGCARPGPVDLTLIGRDGRYGAVLGGAPGDEPAIHLPIEAVLERLGRANIVGLAAAFAPECTGTDTGRNGRPA